MADRTVLVTGGAGFIGSHLVDALVARGVSVRVLDSLEPQVHGGLPAYRNPSAEYVEGSVLDASVVGQCLDGMEAVIHLGAQVGVGQSMYDIRRYVEHNSVGTAVVLEELIRHRAGPSALVVASSMSIYGEGRYDCESCGAMDVTASRTTEQLEARSWDPICPVCGGALSPRPTPEAKRLLCDSVYATTKRDQEELCLAVGRAYGFRAVALRFFNVYGPRQSLTNPYTGVAAIFSSQILSGRRPTVFEDGLQSRDFVHVSDIVDAIIRALSSEAANGMSINVGTGQPSTILEIAETLAMSLGTDIKPDVVGRFRQGDIRHCYADISLAEQTLGYRPQTRLADGMAQLVEWIRDESPAVSDLTGRSQSELEGRGLIV